LRCPLGIGCHKSDVLQHDLIQGFFFKFIWIDNTREEGMAVMVHHLLHPPHCSSPLPDFWSSSRQLRSQISCSSMDPHNNEGRTKFKAFPYVSAPHRNLMVDLVSTVENRLDSQLLPCTLPPDVQYYQNQSGTGVAIWPQALISPRLLM
jgi:hypothetical protein